MKNRIDVRGYIRFALSQLSAQNGAHQFERLCFELARLRHVRNLLPATGPVQAGGDQGRDFESYRTYLGGTDTGHAAFIAAAANEIVVGACTLNRSDTIAKIRDDLTTIFGSGERPGQVFYYCEPDIVVSRRHELQAHCRKTYDAKLDLFDGQAIADLLADRDTFWIAEQFLSIPAELFPAADHDEDYVRLRERWLKRDDRPENYADFVELKQGLRAAVYDESARPDILGWLKRMRDYLDQSSSRVIRQRARYEIAVAQLRGLGDLRPAQPLVAAYYDNLGDHAPSPSELLDAAALAIFCWAARRYGDSDLTEHTVRSWAAKVEAAVDAGLAKATRRADRCTLLEASALLTGVGAPGATRDAVLDDMLAAWGLVAEAAAQTPFFPIWHIANFIETIAPAVAARPAYRTLRDRIDELTGERSGGHAVAEQAERRGIAHLEGGRLVLALDELQRAKAGWFSGEELSRCVALMMLLSECYAGLNLPLASRYYAAGATYLAIHSSDDAVRALAPRAALQLVRTLAGGGEFIGALLMLRQAIGLHFTLESDAGDLDAHPLLASVLAEAAVSRAIIYRLAPELANVVEVAIAAWPIAAADTAPFLATALDPNSPWATMSRSELLKVIDQDLGRSPFEDLGRIRRHSWSALGVEWTIQCVNEPDTLAAALALGATLQVIQAELAYAELLIVPARVVMGVQLGDVADPVMDDAYEVGLDWRVVVPRVTDEIVEGQRHSANASGLSGTWDLQLNRRAFDPEGLRRFLDVRFRQAVDDIPHDDLFGQGAAAAAGPDTRRADIVL